MGNQTSQDHLDSLQNIDAKVEHRHHRESWIKCRTWSCIQEDEKAEEEEEEEEEEGINNHYID
jgi:hypothetical protein